jgi:hypothetical protein
MHIQPDATGARLLHLLEIDLGRVEIDLAGGG